ncbi:MAG: hypothetical protein ACRDFS_03250 [Chloroflexota bacterium]
MGRPHIVLIPSPLNGPLVWAPVSRVLLAQGMAAHVVPLQDGRDTEVPFWIRHAASAARQLSEHGLDAGALLVGHSGAGPLLPVIGAVSPHPIAGYLFVDAGLPIPGQSRLDELEETLPEVCAELRQLLTQGERYPQWTDEEVRDVLPDEGLRRGILAELRPRGRAFFTEQFPTIESWPDAPCGYLQFSDAYEEPAGQARALGWPTRAFQAGHFHMVVDPYVVSAALLDLATIVLAQTR